jgi:hypothetical protein
MRPSGAVLVSGGLAAIAAYAVYAALRWPPKAALFPLVMGIPLLVLAVVQVILELRAAPAFGEPAGAASRVLAVFAWMVGFVALVLFGGFAAAVPIFVFLYLRLDSREGWLLSGVLAAAAWGFFYVVFQRLLHFPFEAGLIADWF